MEVGVSGVGSFQTQGFLTFHKTPDNVINIFNNNKIDMARLSVAKLSFGFSQNAATFSGHPSSHPPIIS